MEDVKEEEALLNKDKQTFLKGVKRLKQENAKHQEEISRLKGEDSMMRGLVMSGSGDNKNPVINRK